MATDSIAGYVLGIDIGANSVGWAAVRTEDGESADLVSFGSRVFDAGVEGDLQKGRDESRGIKRRDARGQRRQATRRARRRQRLFRLFQGAGLLPPADAGSTASPHDILQSLDLSLRAKYSSGDALANVPAPDHVLPYLLRSAALERKLDPFEIGRALYHLAQRRGFLSNRKAAVQSKEEEKEEGAVKEGISRLRQDMKDSGAETLGRHLSQINPKDERIRSRWTAREMLEQEFEAIWNAQSTHHPEILTPQQKKLVHRTIFFQRPLKNQRYLVGDCELEKGRKRAPLALLDAQRFRFLQKVNDLRIISPEGIESALSGEQRAKLIEVLERTEDLKFTQIRKLLALSKLHQFNLERGGEEKIPGSRSTAKLAKLFGPRWNELSKEDRDAIVEDIRSVQKPETLALRGEKWRLDATEAQAFSRISLEPGYGALSRPALAKLLPLLEEGMQYATARKQLYGESFAAGRPLDELPPVKSALTALRNPAVERSLTELRKVVNAIIRKYGKPATVCIELARDLKRPRKQRQEISKNNRQNEKERSAATQKIAAERGMTNPSRSDVEKVLLWEECGQHCPYTGEYISMEALLGEHPQFDIEHIVPFSRSLDNSFMNKTLCQVEENRDTKGNRTPWEAYGGGPERWEQILQRVKAFRGRGAAAKLRRFQLREVNTDEFTSRHLNDTRYASRLAADYLGLLFGGRIDAGRRQRVYASSGQVTADLRNEWGLNAILNDGPTSNGGKVMKTRDDHRHHAIDAVVTALTSPATVRMLSDAASRAQQERRRRYAPIPSPWPNFAGDIRQAIGSVTVSHRVNRRVSGALHGESFYSKPMPGPPRKGKPTVVRHRRKKLCDLTKATLRKIVDSAIAELVRQKLDALGGDPKKFNEPANLPCLPNRRGTPIPIRSVRIWERINLETIGQGARERHVSLGSNHHMEVVAVLDADGNETKWEGAVVTLYEAYRRRQARQPVVRLDHGPGKRVKFSLAGGEAIELDESDGSRGLFVVRTISQEATRDGAQSPQKVEFVRINDARQKKEIRDTGGWLTRSPNRLMDLHCRKVQVDPLGEVHPAHD